MRYYYPLLPNKAERECFVRSVEDALHFINVNDAFRGNLVRRHIAAITEYPNDRLAKYHPYTKMCELDFRSLKDICDTYQIEITHYLACCLIHEASHGYLFARGIPYTRSLRIRIERFCNRQSLIFAEKYCVPGVPWRKLFPLDRPPSPSPNLIDRLKTASRLVRERYRTSR
jgi:hypothetical protein